MRNDIILLGTAPIAEAQLDLYLVYDYFSRVLSPWQLVSYLQYLISQQIHW